LGDVPEHWEIKRLKFVASTIMGQSPNSEDYISDPVERPFLQGNAEFTYRTPSPKYYCNSANKIVPKGALLLSVRAPVGALNEADQEYGIGRGLCAVVPKHKILLKDYAWYLLDVTKTELFTKATGSTYEAVTADEVGDMWLTLPSHTEQQAIAHFLDKETGRIDRLIEKKRQFIETLREKRTALISDAVTKGFDLSVKLKPSGVEWLGDVPEHWEIKKIKWIMSKIGSGITPKGGAEVYQTEGIPLLRSQNIHFEGLRLDDVAFISEDIHNSMKNSKIKPNDVLLNITGASIGRCTFVPENFGEANVNQHVCIIRPKKKVSAEYLSRYLSSNLGQSQIFISQNGTSREGLNFEQLGNFIVLLPDINEQVEINKYLNKEIRLIESLIVKVQQAIKTLQEYRCAIITQAVTGKIDVSSLGKVKDKNPSIAQQSQSSTDIVIEAKKRAEKQFAPFNSSIYAIENLKRQIEKSIMPFQKQQEALQEQIRKITRPSKMMEQYLSEIAQYNKKLLQDSFYKMQFDHFHSSWTRLIEQNETKLKNIISESIKLNLYTEMNYIRNNIAEVLKSSLLDTIQKQSFNNFFKSYTELNNSFNSLNKIVNLPDFVLPSSSRENWFTNLSIAYLTKQDNEFDSQEIEIFNAESDAVRCEVSELSDIFPDIANMIIGAKQALINNTYEVTRHVLVSLREAFTHLLHYLAPNEQVMQWISQQNSPTAYLHENKPTRKARLLYICRGVSHEPLADFFKHDIKATLELINIFQRVHESESSLTVPQLKVIIAKTESAISFVLKIVYEKF